MLSIMTIPMPKIGKPAQEFTLTDRLGVDQWVVPKGITVKVLQTRDAGYIFLPKGCRDERGFIIPRTIFRW